MKMMLSKNSFIPQFTIYTFQNINISQKLLNQSHITVKFTSDTYEKMEELEREEDHYKYVSKLLHSTVSSLCTHQKTMAVSGPDLYTSNASINEAQVCDGKLFFSRSESTTFAKEEIRGKEINKFVFSIM